MENSLANKNGNNEPLDWLNPEALVPENWEFEIDAPNAGCELNVSASDFDEIRCTVVDDITQPPTGGAALYLNQNDFEVQLVMTYLNANNSGFFGLGFNVDNGNDLLIMARARSLSNGRFQLLKRLANNTAVVLDGNNSPGAAFIAIESTAGYTEIGTVAPAVDQHTLRVRFNRTNYRVTSWWNDCPLSIVEENTNLYPFGPAGLNQNSGGAPTSGLIRFDNFEIGEKGSLQNLNKMFWGGVFEENIVNGNVLSNGRRTVTCPATPLSGIQSAIACPTLEGSMYWEIVVDTLPLFNSVEIGIREPGLQLNAAFSGLPSGGGFTLNSGTGVPQDGGFGFATADNVALPGWVAGDVVQLRFNHLTGVLETQTNNVGGWVPHTNLATLTEFYVPYVVLRASGAVTANFALSDLQFAVPVGFNAMSDIFATP